MAIIQLLLGNMGVAGGGVNAVKTRAAMLNLDWLVNVNLFDNETGSFWRGPGLNPAKVKTEVFMLPACVSVEKEGSITNSGRWIQWRYPGPKPLGQSRPDGDIILELGHKIKELYRKDKGVFPEPILNLKWDYDTNGAYDPHKVARWINGYFLEDVKIGETVHKKGSLVPSFAFLQDNGTTAAGNWFYCGSYTEKGNMAARRGQEDAPNQIGLYPEFAWCWPPLENLTNPKARWPFIMKPHGLAGVFGPGLKDGPFPEHYEPLECPVKRNFMNAQRINPTAPVYSTKADAFATCAPRSPTWGPPTACPSTGRPAS
jgi:formate dehydrogenase major subunit